MSPEPVRIAVDLLGGDHAPAVVVDGALQACGADPDLSVLLVGTRPDTDEVLSVLEAGLAGRVTTLVVERFVGMTDPVAHGADPQTSIGAAVRALATGAVHAVVSAGSSGATVAAAVLALGRTGGVRRPALAAILPAARGAMVLLDVGAGMQVKPGDLVQHAVLGCEYARRAAGVAHPRVGLLSVGSEPGKGDRLRRAADAALRLHPMPGTYIGPVEGDDVVSGDRVDVVVTDGFTGNVLLKGLEAALALVTDPTAALSFDAAVPRAAALLGVAGTIVVCHGAANSDDIASGLALAARLARDDAAVRSAQAVPSHTVPAPAAPSADPPADAVPSQAAPAQEPAAAAPPDDHDPVGLAEVHP